MSVFINEKLTSYIPQKRKGRKIFVSYKYWDTNVRLPVPHISEPVSTVRDYVTWLEKKFTDRSDHIYKGEHSDDDLSKRSEDYIWEHLKDKLYDSSVTLVLISPGMRNSWKKERDQWIPWEISYSLRKTERGGRISRRNALLGVILPDCNGNYGYADFMRQFEIIQNNINSKYMEVVRWDDFHYDCDTYINRAIKRSKKYVPKVNL